MLVELGRVWAKYGRNRARLGRSWAKFGRSCPPTDACGKDVRPSPSATRLFPGNCGATPLDLGHMCSIRLLRSTIKAGVSSLGCSNTDSELTQRHFDPLMFRLRAHCLSRFWHSWRAALCQCKICRLERHPGLQEGSIGSYDMGRIHVLRSWPKLRERWLDLLNIGSNLVDSGSSSIGARPHSAKTVDYLRNFGQVQPDSADACQVYPKSGKRNRITPNVVESG